MQNLSKQLYKTLNFKLNQGFTVIPNLVLPKLTSNSQNSYNSQVTVVKQSYLDNDSSFSEIQKESLKNSQIDWQYNGNTQNLLAFSKCEEKPEKNIKNIRNIASKCVKSLWERKVQECDIKFTEDFTQNDIQEFINAFILSNYRFKLEGQTQKQQNDQEPKFSPIRNINVLNENINLENNQRVTSARAALFAREYGNQRANVGTTEFFFEECKNIVKENTNENGEEAVKMEYVYGEDLLKKGMNLHYNVGKASVNPPIAINLTYNGNPDSTEQIALVGKGLTFDAGGLNIKPTGFMETMYIDKQGACNVLGILRAVIEQKLKINITCSIGLAENFISNNSYRPSDILTAYNGKTVEIGNTDAEGRLVLADVITWTNEMHPNIKKMIEFSTLTGACAIALGSRTAGIFSNSDQLTQDLIESGKETSEQMWRLPIFDDHRESIKTPFADITNADKKDRYGGASKAAAFLEHFFNENQEWVHMDIAGPSDFAAPTGVYSAGASAFGVETVFNYLVKQQKQ